MSAKVAVNGSGPLPQRPQKNQGGDKNIDKAMEGPAEKKPRFVQSGPVGQNPNQNQKGFGNKNNQGFGNRKNRGGNQNANKGNFPSPIQNQQNQTKPAQTQAEQAPTPTVKEEQKSVAVEIKTTNAANIVANNPTVQHNQSNQQNNMQNQPKLQNQLNQQMNRQQHGGGGYGNGGDGMGRGNRDRGVKRDRNFGNRDGRDGGGPRGGGVGGDGPRGNRNDDFFINQRLRAISGPTHEIEPIQTSEESKFSGRNRLYIGNISGEVSEDELRELFKPYGEIAEIFCNPEKNFAFLKMDFHANAERAKRELDGSNRKGRALRVRFAPNATILRVSNLTPFVSNELLYRAFEIFGPIEKALVNVDDRGKSTGDGVIEFAKKSSANVCLRYCSDKCFFLTASLRPCVVEPFELNDDNDGLPDKSLNKKLSEFNHERGVGPRFAERGSFEHEYGTRWKQLHELFKSKQEALKRELKMEEEKLEAQMEYARYEHETELLRQELRKRESDNERKKMEWEMREKQAEEMRKRDEEQVRRQQSEMQTRMMRQEEEMRRRQQENTLFMQAQQLNSLLDQQEGGFSGNCNSFDGFGGNNPNPFDFRGNNNNNGGSNGPSGPNGPNGPNNSQDFGFEFGGNQNQPSGAGGDGNRGAQRGGNNAANNNPWERRRRF